jgi:chemosensory pili system protein ChpB (putative protein-glutamate methylesterase)
MSEHTSFEIGAVDVPGIAAAAAQPSGIPPLALLYSDESLLAHVESVLSEMGASVVYRASVAQAERDALLNARPGITLINLDDCCDEHLDHVTSWLDAAHVPVVFNDADISRKLEGWARARWARHLAAKLRGSEDVDPPRPAQAEPTQSVRSVESTTEEDTGTISAFDIGANEVAEIVPIASRPLTPGEIESLLANFPTETAQSRVLEEMDAPAPARAIDETESLSAHVDALLAEPAEPTPAEAAPWDVIAPLEDLPVAAAANEAVHPEAPSIPALSDWQLVDDPVPVVSAPRERATQTAPTPRMEFDFELEPLEEKTVAIVREREFDEMRIEKVTAKPAGANP